MRRIVCGLVLVSAACARAPVPGSVAPPAAVPPPSSIDVVRRISPGAVAGYVTDQEGRPLIDAVVSLDNRVGVHTDSAGRFHVDGVSPGAHAMRVLRIGFDAARQAFTLSADSGTAFAVHLKAASMQLTEVCLTYLQYSVGVRVHDIPGTTIDVAHGDSVEHYALDALHDRPDSSGMRTIDAFAELPGRFYVTVAVPGYRDWQTSVFVPRDGGCHVRRQLVTALLRR